MVVVAVLEALVVAMGLVKAVAMGLLLVVVVVCMVNRSYDGWYGGEEAVDLMITKICRRTKEVCGDEFANGACGGLVVVGMVEKAVDFMEAVEMVTKIIRRERQFVVMGRRRPIMTDSAVEDKKDIDAVDMMESEAPQESPLPPKETQFHKPFNLPNEDSTFSEGTGVEPDDRQNSADVCLGDEPTSLDCIRGTTPDDFHTSAKSNHPDSKETILCPKPHVKDGESNIGVEVLVGNTTDMVLAGHSKDVETHGGPYNNGMADETKNESEWLQGNQVPKLELADVGHAVDANTSNRSFLLDPDAGGDESGTEEEQAAFMKELETFHKENYLEFKPPRFYQEPLNLLKLWRSVIRLGGHEQAILEYEKHKMRSGELPFTDAPFAGPASAGNQAGLNHSSGSGRARRDAAARAMQGWHSQRLLGNGEVGDPIIKDKNATSLLKREKQLNTIGLLKRKGPPPIERNVKVARMKLSKPQLKSMVVDIGPPADWVKINIQRTKDCFEVYALVPGLLREEVRVQSDPVGRLVISGLPEQLDNPWGVTPFKKVVSLPSRIDPHQTSAVVTLHGQLFVRVPFEQSDL
ncbi:hypothetical protein RJ639_046419 [Escallonia herrerae]|uniref:AT-rich interactive domain-containing protein 3 n=1 Tax=Escallonia herrerae TaxID=1293975 RepID=A0AA89B078_9ASTE|nr:hypothetical protein RJ639_046419 [Escallonia herrerae]